MLHEPNSVKMTPERIKVLHKPIRKTMANEYCEVCKVIFPCDTYKLIEESETNEKNRKTRTKNN